MKLELPLRLPSLANQRLHWAAKAKQTKAQRNAVALAWQASVAGYMRAPVTLPCVVTLTRIGPRELDDDNIRPAFKAVRDEIAARLGFDDSKRAPIRWEYQQEKGKPKQYGVRIEIVPASSYGCEVCHSGSLEHPERCDCLPSAAA